MRSETTDTIIIGAGPSGLAVGACLKRAGIPFVMLEKTDRVGSTWRGHYERLHLHTSKRSSELPFYRFPKEYPRYPSRDQVIEHLESYADHFGLAPRFEQEVASVRREGRVWETRTGDTVFHSPHVVVATGYTRVPYIPSWPGQTDFEGPVMHSSSYVSGSSLSGKDVLVIGFGNTGAEIALDLWENDARPALAVRGPVNVIPRDLLGLPIVAIAIAVNKLPPRLNDAVMAPVLRLLYGDISRHGLRKMPYGPMTQIARDARIPLIDVGTMRLIRNGDIPVNDDVERFDGNDVVFVDGRRQRFDAVVIATGFRPRADSILEDGDQLVDADGCPLNSGDEVESGLFFCGFRVVQSGLLREIAAEARRIAGVIASARVDTRDPSSIEASPPTELPIPAGGSPPA